MIRIGGKDFKKVELLQVCQGGKCFFVGVLPAKFFIDVYTVNPVEYDVEKEVALMEASPDMKEYFEKSISEKRKTIDTKGFQRVFDPKRKREIIEFLQNEEYPFFPNSIIATLELENHFKLDESLDESAFLNKIENIGQFSFLKEKNGKFELYIPKKENTILVIDGQHRLEGLKDSGEVKEEYDLIVSFILDYDRSVIARQFYTINYTQKSVNKSLLYHLTGEFSRDLDEITFLHEVIKTLNENKSSPFFKRIKMLGSAPKSLPPEVRKGMTLSQAFLIDYLIYSIKDRKSNSVFQPIFKYYYDKDKYEIVRFIISYFTAIKKIIPDWDNPDKSVISKTIGVGALLKLLNFLFLKMFFDDCLYENPEKLTEIRSTQLIEKLEGLELVDLDSFYGGASAGTVNQLKALMVENVKIFSCKDYKVFEDEFKKEYSFRFSKWIQDK